MPEQRTPNRISKVTSRDCLITASPSSTPSNSPDRLLMTPPPKNNHYEKQQQQINHQYSSACIDWPPSDSFVQQKLPLYLVFGVLYPVLIIASMSLPTWWAHFSLDGLQKYAASSPCTMYGPYLSFKTSEVLVFKLFPDILAYNLAIYIVTIFALLAQNYPRLRRFFNITMRFNKPFSSCNDDGPISSVILKVGEVLLMTIFAGLVLFQFCYFYKYHSWENKSNDTRAPAELAARSMGQVSNLLTGLLLLPISRHSVWTVVFGVSHKDMLSWHKYTGASLVLSTCLHAILWCVAYAQYGYFPQELFTLMDRKFHGYNFTVPLAMIGFVVMLVCMALMSVEPIRRANYDLFYIAHHASIFLFFVMLWHATMCWYYITAGLFLWAVDYSFRIQKVIDTPAVIKSCKIVVPNDPTTECGGIVELAYVVQHHKWIDSTPFMTSNSSENSTSSNGDAKAKTMTYFEIAEVDLDDSVLVEDSANFRNRLNSGKEKDDMQGLKKQTTERSLSHRIGQYVLINIPSIDIFAWHPFSISSAPSDEGPTTHHIKCMGSNEWTGKLYALAEDFDQQDPEAESIGSRFPINIEGPYGMPVNVARYSHIVFIAGGIGITPLYSCYRQLFLQMQSKYLDIRQNPLLSGSGIGLISENDDDNMENNSGASAYLAAQVAPDAANMRVRKISMLWATKTRQSAVIMEDKLQEMAQASSSSGLEKPFEFFLYLTKDKPIQQLQRSSSSLLLSSTPSLSEDANNLYNPNSSDMTHNNNHYDHNDDEDHFAESKDIDPVTDRNNGVKRFPDKVSNNFNSDNVAVMMESGGFTSSTETYIKYERPNLSRIIAQLAADSLYRSDESVLIFACGPDGMVNECEALAHMHAIDFKCEKFCM